MPVFFNQAALTINDQTTLSNIVQGELVATLSADKVAVGNEYRPGDRISYAVSIVNAGSTAYTGLTLTDNLGAYVFDGDTLIPLDYVEGSARLLINGVLQAAPVVTDSQPLTMTGISVPAGSNATILYAVIANQFAPAVQGSIANMAVITGEQLAAPLTASETITVDPEADLSIIKAISPATVVGNEPVTYTLTIQNSGAEPAVATDDVFVTDQFDPILNIQSVTLGGVPLAEGSGYTYDESTGLFTTVPGVITVPAATVQQDPATGAWIVTPGVAVLTVTGTLG